MLFSVRLGRVARLQAAANNRPLLKAGESGPGVAAVQDLLVDLGFKFPISFRHGKADGIFGAETTQRVKDFQAKNDLVPDGVLGAKTLGALDGLIVHNDVLEFHDAVVLRAKSARNIRKVDYT